MLASPYAVQTAGWCIIFLSLLPVPLVYFYTAILLKRCLDKFSDLRSYDDIAEKAFGKKGLIIFFVLFYLEIYSCLVSYAVSIADNLVQIVSYQIGETGLILSNRWFLTSLAMLVVLPMTWLRDLRALSFTSMGSTITIVAVILCVIWVAIVGGEDIAISSSNLDFIHLAQVPVSTSIFLFCYSGHIVLPSIYLSMKDRTKFTKVIYSFPDSFPYDLSLHCIKLNHGHASDCVLLVNCVKCNGVTIFHSHDSKLLLASDGRLMFKVC